ncbi:MAG TPA: hypothetical protein VLH94_00970 [Spirochaetia bacterium]|nr:hypothetical protein [Spirochaetia bacterium]
MAERKIVSQTHFVDLSKVGDRKEASVGSVYVGTKDADWTCNSCNHGPINGRKKLCPMCGNPKDSTETYVASTDNRPFLSDKDMEDRGVDLDHGSDEECPYCKARIAPKTQICPQCNGTIKNVGKTKRICPTCSRESNALICPSCGDKTVSKSEQSSSIPPSPPSGNFYTASGDEQPTRTPPWFLIGGIIAAVAIIVFGIIMIFSPKERVGTVVSSSWSCSVPYQEYQYNQHSDWYVPVGGDYISQSDEIHHYDQIYVRTDRVCNNEWEVVGSHNETTYERVCETHSEYSGSTTTCYDDGTCDTTDDYNDVTECHSEPRTESVDDYGYVEHCHNEDIYDQVPVYSPYYVYNIWEWVSLNPLTSNGTDNTIVCPKVSESETARQSGNESTTCETTFQVSKKQYSYKPNCSTEFPNYFRGSEWNLTITGPFIKAVAPLP